jgi:hypothetical protein
VSVVCCRSMSMRRADHSFRGVLTSVVCLNECDREVSIKKRSWPTRDFCAIAEKKSNVPVGGLVT